MIDTLQHGYRRLGLLKDIFDIGIDQPLRAQP
jgi:hypothetical protein